MTVHIGLLLYRDVDLIDAIGPFEVFLTASRLATRAGDEAPFVIHLLSPDGHDVRTFGDMHVTHLAHADAIGALDMLIVPGTVDLDTARADRDLADAVQRLSAIAGLTASVCTGSFLLADAGLLAGRTATTHWEDVDALQATGLVGEAVTGPRWVDTGDVITGAGLVSGIHLGIHLVSRLAGLDLAEHTARQIDLEWSPDAGVTTLAGPPHRGPAG